MKECWNCGNYRMFYTKGYGKFENADMGSCVKFEKIVGKHKSCEFWRGNLIRRRIRKSVCLNMLDAALENIAQIRQVLCEEYEDNKINPQ